MTPRPIAPPAQIPGEIVEVADRDVRFTLYFPSGYIPPNGPETLTVHFHGAPWFAIEEHRRRDLAGPLIAFSNGEGSSRYRAPFLDRDRLGRWVSLVEAALRRRGGEGRVDRVNISSFSAGYGAVREIVKEARYRALVHRIVLADSMYAGWEPLYPGAKTRRPARLDIEPWAEFARLAAAGKKEFVLTHSQVPTDTYANSVACARWVCGMVGQRPTVLAPSGDRRYPLLTRCDVGGFHVWGYGGADAGAHVVHARRIADVWRALDHPR
ncbi:MAG: hypothetical protein ACO1SV_01320 [Fimbriimonas sp.]